jgi:hypothetical protein
MSSGARVFLGVFLVLIGLGFLALVPVFAAAGDAFPPQAMYGLGALGVFCGLGALACFSQASHPLTIRILGGAVFAVSLMYVVGQATGTAPPPPPRPQPANAVEARLQRRSSPSLVNSLLFFGLVGLPSGYAALMGRYPGWGSHARAFSGGKKKPERR